MSTTVTPEAIKEARRRLGLSQTAFAALLNERVPGLRTNKIAVHRWEYGTHRPSGPAAEALRKIIAELPSQTP